MPYSIIHRLIKLLCLMALAISLSSCDWDNDVYMNDNTGQEDSEEETEPVETGASDTAPDTTDESRDSDENVKGSDSGPDTDGRNSDDDHEHYYFWRTNALEVVVSLPGDSDRWADTPEELCVYVVPVTPEIMMPPPPDMADDINEMSTDPEPQCKPVSRDDLNRNEMYFSFQEGSLLDVGEFPPFVAAILFIDGNHLNDEPREGEDYFGSNRIKTADWEDLPSWAGITLVWPIKNFEDMDF